MSEEVRAAVRQDGCGWLRVWADLPLLGQWDRTKSVVGRTWLRRCWRPREPGFQHEGVARLGGMVISRGRVVDPAGGFAAAGSVAPASVRVLAVVDPHPISMPVPLAA